MPWWKVEHGRGYEEETPPYFEEIEFQSPRSDEAQPPSDERSEVDCPQLELPTMLPPNYEVLKEENDIQEANPPKSCPCFRDERDPEGRLRHLAGLILH